jgi:hypothetical protein
MVTIHACRSDILIFVRTDIVLKLNPSLHCLISHRFSEARTLCPVKVVHVLVFFSLQSNRLFQRSFRSRKHCWISLTRHFISIVFKCLEFCTFDVEFGSLNILIDRPLHTSLPLHTFHIVKVSLIIRIKPLFRVSLH